MLWNAIGVGDPVVVLDSFVGSLSMWCSMTVLSIEPVMIWLLLVQGINRTPKMFAACSVCNASGLLYVSGYDQSNTCQESAQLSGATAKLAQHCPALSFEHVTAEPNS